MAIQRKLDLVDGGKCAAAAEMEGLIPGLPDEIAEHCLLHLPFPHQSAGRSVSSAWKRAISDPSFLQARKSMSLSEAFIFVFAFHRCTGRLQWQAFDPRSRRWLLLPPMPIPSTSPSSAFACASNPAKGELYVLGGMNSDNRTPLQTLISYKASTNSWSVAPKMPTPRSYFAAGVINGMIIAAGGDGESTVDCYDPVTKRWSAAANMQWGMSRYDAAVVGGKMYVTEGWTWPFEFSPRGEMYDPNSDTWTEMRIGMREGWTGSSVVLYEKLFVITECGDCRVKVYEEESDTWRRVVGPSVPAEVEKPYTVTGLEGRIYVVASGMWTAVGTVSERKGEWEVEWEVVTGRKHFADFSPCGSQVLYA